MSGHVDSYEMHTVT